uniref:SRCR domain-containing protein n=1 Tax=Cyclopterus lumpus TaxID=8103 RepID=A0A8C2Z1E2_CYCLU
MAKPNDLRLVGGSSRCAGELEMKQMGTWEKVDNDMSLLNLKTADVVCGQLDCVIHYCMAAILLFSPQSLCLCEDDFDRQDAEVVCRELGCGVPSVLQGALYGESESPMWTKEFQCEGHESVLLDCRSSARNTGSADFTEPDEVKLVGGSNHCVGGLELKHEGNWRPVDIYSWDLVSAAVVCRQLDCGSALSIGRRDDLYHPNGWRVKTSCGQSDSTIRECHSCFVVCTDYNVSDKGGLLTWVLIS